MASVDAVDFGIYRYLSPDGAARFWGCRRVFDPRVGAREISERVGVSETGVRTRLRSLRERGFLRGAAVWVNPSLFGASLQLAEIPLGEVGESRRLLEDLRLAEGITFARDVLDERDRKLQVYFVADTAASIARRAQLLRRLAGDRPLRGPTPYFVPSATQRLTPLDWRIVAAVRASPDATLPQWSRALRISLKTLSHRYHALLDSRAIWWTHGAASTEMPLALLTVGVDDPADPGALAAQVADGLGGWMPVAPDGRGLVPTARPGDFAGLLLADSPAAVESAALRILETPGVAAVRRTFALGSGIYPEWFDERIAAQTAAG